MKKDKKKVDSNNDITKIMITAIAILLVLIGFLGVSIYIKSSETGEIDRAVEQYTKDIYNK